jgi:hypothetical protein
MFDIQFLLFTSGEEILNVFKLDPEYDVNEEKYKVGRISHSRKKYDYLGSVGDP